MVAMSVSHHRQRAGRAVRVAVAQNQERPQTAPPFLWQPIEICVAQPPAIFCGTMVAAVSNTRRLPGPGQPNTSIDKGRGAG